MDTEAKTNHTQNESASGCTCGAPAPDMMSVLESSALPSGVCSWLRCLRGPGMTLTYSMEKRHIPDMDAERQKRKGGQTACATELMDTADTAEATGNAKTTADPSTGGQESGKSSGQNGKDSRPSCHPQKGQNVAPGIMRCAGTCEVRYFDLAVGAVLVLMVGGMLKCLMGCCRCIKRKL